MLCLPETNNKPLTDHIITFPEQDDEVRVNWRSPEEIPLQDPDLEVNGRSSEKILLQDPQSWPQGHLEVLRNIFSHDLKINWTLPKKNLTAGHLIMISILIFLLPKKMTMSNFQHFCLVNFLYQYLCVLTWQFITTKWHNMTLTNLSRLKWGHSYNL